MQELIRKLYPVPETAEILGVQRTTVYKLIADGAVKRVKIGRRSLVTSESIDAYIERLTDS